SDGTDTDSEEITITVTGGGDTTPPETTIESSPKDVIKVKKGKKATAKYVVTANEPGATIEGRINGGVWQGPLAQGGIKIPDLGKGNYTIEFRATDAAGNVDQSPASDSFVVKKKKKKKK
ncbi:MAG TPA: hypothetical protein VD766_13890, partial [Solirubrobacterales bacterium]|nr:hypothetical protein [Solirubrobacterales bacterium]